MKKHCAVFALFLCLILSGCVHTIDLNFYETNYNNVYSATSFFPTKDKFFYFKNENYNMKFYVGSRYASKKLADNYSLKDEYLTNEMFVYNNALYLQTENQTLWKQNIYQNYADTTDPVKGACSIYRYDLKQNTFKKIVEQINRQSLWMIVDEYVVFTRYDEDRYFEYQNKLYVMNTETGQETLICEPIYSFGIVDGKVRYLLNSNAVEIFEYDINTARTKKLCEFPLNQFDDDFIVNYTDDYVVLFSKKNGKYVIYDLNNNDVAVYEMGHKIHSLVACDKYAFAAISDDSAYGEINICRIKLSTGEVEMIDGTFAKGYFVYAVCDELVYITATKERLLANKTEIYEIDMALGTTSKVLSY